ncbi:MAG: hypothetical protein HYY21_00340 [Candidatus Tectomicrobia bacterium]|nr:hypothetical protein [Candidatus Tectomicrobia bacterium]
MRWVAPAVAAAAVALVFGVASCARDPLKQAFEGRFLASENNRIITNYCQSCHVHRNLVPDRHLAEVKSRYTDRRFRTAEECRECHGVNFKFFGPEHRRTLHPPDGRTL